MENKKYPLRILHVVGIMDYGGAETLIMNWYRNIDRSKYQFDFLVHFSKKGKFDDEIKQLGGNIYYIPRYKGVNHLEYIRSFKKHLNNHIEHQIIHFHIRSTTKFLSKIAKELNRKTILHSHSISERKGFSSLVKRIYRNNITKYIDQNIACSQEAGKWLFGNKEFVFIRNAIPIDNYYVDESVRQKLRKQLNIENKKVIGHIGRFTYEKNHEFLIDIIKRIKPQENIVLLLIGEGPLYDDIMKKAKGLDVIFLGAKSNINEWLMAMDVFVFPSLYEGFGIAAIEAQASGLPVICSSSLPYEVKITENIMFVSTEESLLWVQIIKDINCVSIEKRNILNRKLLTHNMNMKNNKELIEDFYDELL